MLLLWQFMAMGLKCLKFKTGVTVISCNVWVGLVWMGHSAGLKLEAVCAS